MNIQLSKNFSLDDLIASATASKYKIDNTPTAEHIGNLKILCEMCLQPVRERYGKSISINNGYRSKALCDAMLKEGYSVSPTTDHSLGRASDIRDKEDKKNNKKLFDCIVQFGDFHQLIWECNAGNGHLEYPDWVHVGYRRNGNRKQVFKMVGGKTTHRNYDGVRWS